MDPIDSIRSFNRATLRRVGLVEEAYVSEGFSLPQARVLVEIAQMEAPHARALAAQLGLNEGYLSRLLSGLAAAGLVVREVSGQDRRARLVRLTAEGRAAADRLAAVSRQRVARWFDGAAPGAAARCAEHLRRADQDLTDGDPDPVALTGLRVGDIGWLTQAHAEAYAAECGFDHTFEPLVAGILADFATEHDPSCERAWIARQGPQRLGSIFCVKDARADVAKLRLFYLMPEARGLGLGQRLLTECTQFAQQAGYRQMTLWTHDIHVAARGLYGKSGFTRRSSIPKRSFGRDVIEEVWVMDL